MRTLGLSIVVFGFLTACGGGSSDSGTASPPPPPPPTPTPNTAPTLTGSLLLTVPANESGSLVVDVADAEGDTITASTQESDWLSLNISDGQLTVTADPTVFELGDNTVDITLSDGTDSSVYAMTINVENNPSSYSYAEIDPDVIRGSWQLSDGRELFVDREVGFFA